MLASLRKKLVITLSIFLAVVALAPAPAFAQTKEDVCRGVGTATGSGNCNTAPTAVNGIIGAVVNILSSIVGIVAVIMIIFGGFKYVTSGGDSSGVNSAKNTILYALVGLIVALSARIIVSYVLDRAT